MYKYSRDCIACVVFIVAVSVTVDADRVFKYPRIQQEKDQWCWGACAQWILGYHGIELSQTEICKYGFTDGKVRDQWNWIYTETEAGEPIQSSNFPTIPPDWDWSKGMPPMPPMEPQTCYGRGINIIIEHWGVSSKVKGTGKNAANYTISEEEFKRDIDNGYPFVVRYNWDNGGGHFVVAMGYQNKMCWLMNPWKDDGIQIYNYQWVMDGTDPKNKHHKWDYTLQTARIDTVPELTTEFPSSIKPGTKLSLVLSSRLNGRDVTQSTFFTSLTEGVKIDSATRTISWTQTEQGPKSVKFIREFGNTRDTIVKSFDETGIRFTGAGTNAGSIRVKNTGQVYWIYLYGLSENFQPATLQLLASNGTRIFMERVRIVKSGSVSFTINKSRFASGVYLLSISHGRRHWHTEKLVF